MRTHRNYPLLLASQFLSAFGDNVILMVILGQLTFEQKAGRITEDELRTASAVYTSLLYVPFVVLAPIVGFLNDRFAKTRWLLGGNFIKLSGSLIAMASVFDGHAWEGIGYFLVGAGACVYSPAKYGILPEILPTERLVKANGTVEMLTLVAILTGTITGAKMIDRLPVLTCYLILLAVFGASLLLNACMTRTPHDPAVRFRNSVGEFVQHFGDLLREARLARVLLCIGLFWFCGSTLKINFQPWGLNTLGLKDNTTIAALNLWLAVGVMIGSVLAGQLHRVGDLRRVRLYGWLLAAFVSLVGLITGQTRPPLVYATLIAAGVSAGLYLIPLNAALQAESHPGKLGKTIATQNFIDNLAMVLAAGLVLFAVQVGVGASGVFLGLATLLALLLLALKIPARPAPAKRE